MATASAGDGRGWLVPVRGKVTQSSARGALSPSTAREGPPEFPQPAAPLCRVGDRVAHTRVCFPPEPEPGKTGKWLQAPSALQGARVGLLESDSRLGGEGASFSCLPALNPELMAFLLLVWMVAVTLEGSIGATLNYSF